MGEDKTFFYTELTGDDITNVGERLNFALILMQITENLFMRKKKWQ
ncbi:MAG: hypothetical protein WBA93_07755 [Microcoleaceae cyanobacterium]